MSSSFPISDSTSMEIKASSSISKLYSIVAKSNSCANWNEGIKSSSSSSYSSSASHGVALNDSLAARDADAMDDNAPLSDLDI